MEEVIDKPKVLIFSDCYIYGGSERLMTFLLKNEGVNNEFDLVLAFRKHRDYVEGLKGDLQKLGINISVYPLRLLANETLFHKINCTRLPSLVKRAVKLPFFLFQALGLYFLFNVLVFAFFIKKMKPGIVHVNNGGYPGALTCNQFVLSAHMCGIKAIVYQVNNIAYKTSNPVAAYYDRIIYRCVSMFITASLRAGQALARERRFNSKKIMQIPNTILPEKISASREDIIKALKWPGNSFLLIQVAFLTARKGQINLIKAVQQIVEDNVEGLASTIRLVLVGNGEDEHMLKEYVKEAGLNDHIYFAGYIPNSADYINGGDVFLLPSVANEDMPLSLLTAMSYGKPIVASRFAGIAEAVEDGQNGLLIEPEPASIVEELRSAILLLYRNADKRIEMGRNAAQAFKERYSEEIYARRLNNLYWKVYSNHNN